MPRHASVRRLAPYRYSARFRTRRVPRKWRHRLEPPAARARRPHGLPGLWTRLRRLIWAWWPWGAATIWALVRDAWNWAAFFGTMAFLTYLAAPRERSPNYGLDHFLPTADPAFLDSVVGLTGITFLDGNKVELLNNGDEFYPVDAAGDSRREGVGHDRGLHLLGREISDWNSRTRSPIGRARG